MSTSPATAPASSRPAKYEPATIQFKGLGEEDILSIAPEEAKAFEMWCRPALGLKYALELFQTVAELAKSSQTGTGSPSSQPTNAAEQRRTDMLLAAIAYAQKISDNPRMWCIPSTEGGFGTFGQEPKSSAFAIIKNWKTTFTLYSPFSLSQTPLFSELHNAWVKTMQVYVAPLVSESIEGEAKISGVANWPQERQNEFHKRTDACRHAFDITPTGSHGYYETNFDPKRECCLAYKMIDPQTSCVPKPKQAATSWSWPPEPAILTPPTTWDALEKFMDSYLRNRQWLAWAKTQTFVEPVVNRGFFQKVASSIFTWTIGAIAGLAGVITVVARSLGFAITYWQVIRAVFGIRPLASILWSRMSNWFRGRFGGPRGGTGAPSSGGAAPPVRPPRTAGAGEAPGPSGGASPRVAETVVEPTEPRLRPEAALRPEPLSNVATRANFGARILGRLALVGRILAPASIVLMGVSFMNEAQESRKIFDCEIRELDTPTCIKHRRELRESELNRGT